METRALILWPLSILMLVTTLVAQAQKDYEPLHGVTGYDYIIKGELELKVSNSIDFKNGTKGEGTYTIKSPVFLAFNLNDLNFFEAQPKEFVGYVEGEFIASAGWFDGGLMDISNIYGEAENRMWVDEHVKWWENGELTEIKAHGELDPDIKVAFSIPDYPEKYKAGLDNLQFRIAIKISGDADTQQNVTVEYNSRIQQESGTAFTDEEEAALKELEKADPSAVAGMKEGLKLMRESYSSRPSDFFVKVGCGTFYGGDLGTAEMANNLIAVDGFDKEKIAFERQFEQKYFKDLPRINVMKLVDFLLKPAGIYETPIVGSFSSDSEYSSEKVSYNGTLKFFGNQVTKYH